MPEGAFDGLAPADRRVIDRAVRQARRFAKKNTPTAPYGFLPLAGEPGRDAFQSFFVDLDATAEAKDYECTGYSYDGHLGHDTSLRTFLEQDIGVPIFAARDGLVRSMRDGEPDRNTEWADGQRSNFVLLDHYDGTTTLYLHMRRGSVRVAVGDTVTAGTEIGQVGSSGFSRGPHLHFETRSGANTVEPSHGPCQPAASWWQNQPPLLRDLVIRDARWSRNLPPAEWAAFLESAEPRLRSVRVGDRGIFVEVTVFNLPGGSDFAVELLRPDGSVAERLAGSFGNAELLAFSWWSLPLQSTFDIAGTWSLTLSANGQRYGDALPLRVLAASESDANRPPRAVDTVRLEPALPSVEWPLRCVADAPLIGLDPDHDLIRYRFEWKVNGVTRRDTVNALSSDMLARGIAREGDAVSCRVTASDGELAGPSRTVETAAQAFTCVPDATTLCLLDNHYQVRATWRSQYDGSSGQAQVTPQSDLSGLLWFTSADNPELMVKVVDFDGVIKVFYSQLSDLEIELEVTETATRLLRQYRNAPQNCGAIDQDAFPKLAGDAVLGNCVPSATTLCLDDRFQVEASWQNHYDGSTGEATANPLPGGIAGALSFNDPGNVELLVKALDFGDRVLVLWGALSDLGYGLRVTDTASGAVRSYTNPPGRYCGGLDPAAF